MKKMNIHEAKTHFSALLTEVEKKGEKIVICRFNVPIAEIVPISRKRRTIPSERLKRVVFAAPPELPTEDDWGHV